MRGFLVRVGIDSTSGDWNAPVNEETKGFMFIPIPDCRYNPSGEYVEGGKRTYAKEVLPALQRFAKECDNGNSKKVSPGCFKLPKKLEGAAMHLDPDFHHLTYGDSGSRGKPLIGLDVGDFLVFYAALRSIQTEKLVYALIGKLELAGQPLHGKSAIEQLSGDERLKNAHSCWLSLCEKNNDVIVSGSEAPSSGLFDRCVEIGCDKTKRQYYVSPGQLDEWGGFKNSKSGWLQRSPRLLKFEQPGRFMNWLQSKEFTTKRAHYRAEPS